MASDEQNAEVGQSSSDNYRYTEPETGEVFVDCDGCGETWPEALTESIECPDCGRERVECPDCREMYDA